MEVIYTKQQNLFHAYSNAKLPQKPHVLSILTWQIRRLYPVTSDNHSDDESSVWVFFFKYVLSKIKTMVMPFYVIRL